MNRIEPAVAQQIAHYASDPTLTSREIEILQLVSGGHSNKQIGVTLTISEETAKTHVRNIMAKLGARDRTHAVTLAVRRGIIQPYRIQGICYAARKYNNHPDWKVAPSPCAS